MWGVSLSQRRNIERSPGIVSGGEASETRKELPMTWRSYPSITWGSFVVVSKCVSLFDFGFGGVVLLMLFDMAEGWLMSTSNSRCCSSAVIRYPPIPNMLGRDKVVATDVRRTIPRSSSWLLCTWDPCFDGSWLFRGRDLDLGSRLTCEPGRDMLRMPSSRGIK